MLKLKTFAVALLAAASVGVGGLAVAQPATAAAPMYTCAQAKTLASYYISIYLIDANDGDGLVSPSSATLFAKAQGLISEYC